MTTIYGTEGARALQAAIQLVESSSNRESRYLLARCFADAATRKGERADPIALQSAQQTLQQLVDEFPNIADYRFALCLTWTSTAIRRNERRSSDFELLRSQLQQAVQHSGELVRQHPNEPAYQLLRANASLRLANVPVRPKNPVDTRKKFASAMRIHDDLAAAFPDSIPCQIARVTCKISFARHLNRIGETTTARSLAQDSIKLIEEMQQAGVPDRLVIKPLAEANRQLDLIPSSP